MTRGVKEIWTSVSSSHLRSKTPVQSYGRIRPPCPGHSFSGTRLGTPHCPIFFRVFDSRPCRFVSEPPPSPGRSPSTSRRRVARGRRGSGDGSLGGGIGSVLFHPCRVRSLEQSNSSSLWRGQPDTPRPTPPMHLTTVEGRVFGLPGPNCLRDK